jgi:DNA-binding response OmpR family regulator
MVTPRILVIDDDDQVRSMLRLTLEDAGFEVETAADGKAGTKAFREAYPDLAIADIVMPEKEGLETIQELRTFSFSMPIIAISGGGKISPMSYLAMAKQFGASRTFFKPVDRRELLSAVRELLSEDNGANSTLFSSEKTGSCQDRRFQRHHESPNFRQH